MLEKLSNVLKRTTDKIANAIFLDKNLVDSIVKDLQRALIEADVNVQLVISITNKIKQSALDERIKGLEKKEHLIKLLHDELISLLGEKREISLSKQNRIMLLGLYGAGKCVHANTKIQLADGNIQKAKELYEKYSHLYKEEFKDEFIIDIADKNIYVPSFNANTLKIENKKVTHLWKLKKEQLYEIYLENGNDFSIKVTPEHPFFVLREGKVAQVRADEIQDSDYVAIPQTIDVQSNNVSLADKLKKLNLSIYTTQEEKKQILLNKNKTLKEINKSLKFKQNYCSFTLNVKEGKIPIELIEELPNFIKIKDKKAQTPITLPTSLTTDLAEFLGYVMGDGNIRRQYIQISNEDPEIINRIKELSKILFNTKPNITPAKRTEKMYDIRLCSTTLVKIFSIFGLYPGKKGKQLSIPEEILLSNNEILRVFIKAYFDCDSSPSKGRYIELISESQILIQQMNMLLKRFGIISSISRKYINSIPYFRLSIKSRYAEKYADKIGYLIKHKQNRIENYRSIGLIQGCGNQDMISIGKYLKESRNLLGFSIGEIQTNAVNSYGRYEEKGLISREKLKQLVVYYSLKNKGIYLQLLEDINNNIKLNEKYSNYFINGIKSHLNDSNLVKTLENSMTLTSTGQLCLQKIKQSNSQEIIKTLSLLANSEICWLPIKKINPIKNDEEYVYDLTIEDNHSFIAEGFIVHNTTTISKLATYYAKRGHSVCAIGLDVHRPAAAEQLKQLGEKNNFPVFINPKEKSPEKIYKSFQKDIEKYKVVFIDTAGRDALDESLIKEIKSIDSLIKPTETLLVMPADIGQSAKKQAQTFKEALNITGVIITRMDSTAKGGGALTACAQVQAPVIFIGTGEKPSDLETFDPESFLSRLLGMGDLKGLMEKIHSVVDKKQIEEQQRRLQEGKFTLRDLQTQLESMESLGSMDKLLSMIPGLGKVKDKIPEGQLEQQQDKVKRWKHAINSMTKEEIENPELIEKQTTRIQRIAKGSGTSTSEIRALIKQYKMLKEMISSPSSMSEGGLDQKTMMKMAKKYAKKLKF